MFPLDAVVRDVGALPLPIFRYCGIMLRHSELWGSPGRPGTIFVPEVA